MKTKIRVILLYIVSFILSANLYAQWENTGTAVIDTAYYKYRKDSLYIRMKIRLDNLDIKSGLSADLIPLLQASGDTVQLPHILVNGRVRHLIYMREEMQNDPRYAIVVRRKNKEAQSVEYTARLPYSEWMNGATLGLYTDLCGCGWEPLASRQEGITKIDIPEQKLAFTVPPQEPVKRRHLSGSAFLDFPVNKTTIYPEYRNNPSELRKIQATIDSVRTNRFATIREISIKGHASPEGSYANNTRLARERTYTLIEYVKELYDFTDVKWTIDFEPEDWKGLEERVKVSNLAEKEEILAVIRAEEPKDFDARELRLKQINGGVPYRYILKNIYPALRHSDYTVHYIVRNFTVEEAKEQFYTAPEELSLNEMFQVARTYPTGSDQFNEVFEIAVRLYPDDPISNLNAANAALLRKDVKTAWKHLEKAAPGKEKLLAEGVAYMMEGDEKNAKRLLLQAKDAGATEADAYLLRLE